MCFRRMEDIMKTKEAQVLTIDHDEAEVVDDSEDDLDLDFPAETIDYRPGSSRPRHAVDTRLKKPITNDTETSPRSLDVVPSPRSVDKVKKKRSPTELTSRPRSVAVDEDEGNPCASPDQWTPRADQWDKDELNPAARGFLSQPSLSRPRSRDGSMGDMPCELDLLTSERPKSRGQGEELGPLRAPSPTAAQIMSSLRARHSERPPSPSRGKKLR